MPRVLVNHYSATPNKLTGLSVYSWNILEALARSGRFSYLLATGWSKDAVPASIFEHGVDYVAHPMPANVSNALLRNTWELPKLAERHRCDLIFNTQPWAASLRSGGRARVIVLHDLYRLTNPELTTFTSRMQWRFVVDPALRNAHALIAVSNATCAATARFYPGLADRLHTVQEAAPRPAAAAGQVPVQGPYALMVANVTPNKNVDLVFEALDMLRRRGMVVPVHLVGRDEVGKVAELRQRYPDSPLNFVGPVSDDVLRGFYAAATCYVNASHVEGFCLPILEAHAFGVPVICSDLPVLREVAGAGALFIEPKNPETLADALARLFTDADLREAMRCAARTNAQRFSWERAARETEAVFDAALARAGTEARR